MDIRLKQADISDHSWDFPDLVKKESFDSTLIDERCAQRVDRSFLCFRDVNLLQDRWNADGIQAQIRFFACFQGFGRYMYRGYSFWDIKDHIDRNGGIWPMPVARAAPRIPSFGKKPELKNPHVVLVYSP